LLKPLSTLSILLILLPVTCAQQAPALDALKHEAFEETDKLQTFTQQMVDQAKTTLGTLSAMGSQMQTSMLPALAAQLKMQPIPKPFDYLRPGPTEHV